MYMYMYIYHKQHCGHQLYVEWCESVEGSTNSKLGHLEAIIYVCTCTCMYKTLTFSSVYLLIVRYIHVRNHSDDIIVHVASRPLILTPPHISNGVHSHVVKVDRDKTICLLWSGRHTHTRTHAHTCIHTHTHTHTLTWTHTCIHVVVTWHYEMHVWVHPN